MNQDKIDNKFIKLEERLKRLETIMIEQVISPMIIAKTSPTSEVEFGFKKILKKFRGLK